MATYDRLGAFKTTFSATFVDQNDAAAVEGTAATLINPGDDVMSSESTGGHRWWVNDADDNRSLDVNVDYVYESTLAGSDPGAAASPKFTGYVLLITKNAGDPERYAVFAEGSGAQRQFSIYSARDVSAEVAQATPEEYRAAEIVANLETVGDPTTDPPRSGSIEVLDAYPAPSYRQLDGVSIDDSSNVLTYTGLRERMTPDGASRYLVDKDDDKRLDINGDWWGGRSVESDNRFTGYVIERTDGFKPPIIEIPQPGNAASKYYVVGDENLLSGLQDSPSAGETTITATHQPVLPFSEAVCFAAGTLIATPDGECPVETLDIGDSVLTADGRSVPIKWIGRQTTHKLFTPRERFCPVRVRAGALGHGRPHDDLILTPDHALIIDELAINASCLVNGSSIVYEPFENLPDRVTYYHVETEAHEVILANGAAAETYVDYVSRRVFDNHAEYIELYGEERIIAEMPRPRIAAMRLVPLAIKTRLSAASDAA